ncbi:hypothetical protein FEJ81_06420 [Natrinema versiforme]|uniref:Uncharacterized protein n=1 Tax=Natrinema versiforme TaxID=88724 RepID=A0A4P8WL46_9EURY|nr:hypothetical protein FEJ81_06420 [Natrinema versiforme]
MNYVIGVHGTEFTNTTFTDSTATLYFSGAGIYNFYYFTYQQLGFDYDFFISS